MIYGQLITIHNSFLFGKTNLFWKIVPWIDSNCFYATTELIQMRESIQFESIHLISVSYQMREN